VKQRTVPRGGPRRSVRRKGWRGGDSRGGCRRGVGEGASSAAVGVAPIRGECRRTLGLRGWRWALRRPRGSTRRQDRHLARRALARPLLGEPVRPVDIGHRMVTEAARLREIGGLHGL